MSVKPAASERTSRAGRLRHPAVHPHVLSDESPCLEDYLCGVWTCSAHLEVEDMPLAFRALRRNHASGADRLVLLRGGESSVMPVRPELSGVEVHRSAELLRSGLADTSLPRMAQRVAVVSFSADVFEFKTFFEGFASVSGVCSVSCAVWVCGGTGLSDDDLLRILRKYADERNIAGISYEELLTSSHEDYLQSILVLLERLSSARSAPAVEPGWLQLHVSLSRDRCSAVTATVSVGHAAALQLHHVRTRASLTWKL